MVVISESVSCKSLDFPNQRKAYMLRHVKKLAWEKIADEVVDLRGEHPSWVCVKDTVQELSVTKGCRKFKYSRCGRKPWKMTADIQQWLIRRLIAQRATQILTSITLRMDLSA